MEGDHPTTNNGKAAPTLQRLGSKDRLLKYQNSVDRLKALEAKDAASQQRAPANSGANGQARSASAGVTPAKAKPTPTGSAKVAKKAVAKLVKKELQTKKVQGIAKKAAAGKPKVGRVGRAAKKVATKATPSGLKAKARASAKAANARSASGSRHSARSEGAASNQAKSRSASAGSKDGVQKKRPQPVSATLKQSKAAQVQKVVRIRGRDPRDEIPKAEKFHRKPRVHLDDGASIPTTPAPKRAPRPVKPAVPAQPAATTEQASHGDMLEEIAGAVATPAQPTAAQVNHEPATAADQGGLDDFDITDMIEAQEATAKKETTHNSGEKKVHQRSNEKTVPTEGTFSNLFGDEQPEEVEAAPVPAQHKSPEKVASHHQTPHQSAAKMAEETLPVAHEHGSAAKEHHQTTPHKAAAHDSHHASAHKEATPAAHTEHHSNHASAAKPAAAETPVEAAPHQSESSMTSQNNSSQGAEVPDQPNAPASEPLDLESLAAAQPSAPAAQHEEPGSAQKDNGNVSFF